MEGSPSSLNSPLSDESELSSPLPTPHSTLINCPQCGHSGSPVDLITVKSMVVPSRMMQVRPKSGYFFCAQHDCATVYFSEENSFIADALREAVYQKDDAGDVPVCY